MLTVPAIHWRREGNDGHCDFMASGESVDSVDFILERIARLAAVSVGVVARPDGDASIVAGVLVREGVAGLDMLEIDLWRF